MNIKFKKYIIWSLLFVITYIYYHPHGIFVLADPLSVHQYRKVLTELKETMPPEYDLVTKHIDQISINYIMGRNAGSAQETPEGKKKIKLLENTFVQGPGYAHSTLVHEACHGLQFDKKLPFTPFCENQAREHACNQWGLRVLRTFKAKPEMIAHYESIAEGKTVYGNSCLRNGHFNVMPEL